MAELPILRLNAKKPQRFLASNIMKNSAHLLPPVATKRKKSLHASSALQTSADLHSDVTLSKSKRKSPCKLLVSHRRVNNSFSKPFDRGQLVAMRKESDIEKELEKLEDYHEQLLAEYDARFELMSSDAQLLELKKENLKLRNEFKKLNGFITELVEWKKKETLHRRHEAATAKQPRPTEDLEILTKQLASVESEYQQVSVRVEQVADPQYVAGLQERIVELGQQIKKFGKSKKCLELEQMHRGKTLSKTGESEFLLEINSMRQGQDVLDEKIKEIDAGIQKNATLLKEKNTKLNDLKNTMKRLAGEAETIGVNPDGDAHEETADKYQKLQSKKRALEKAINLMRTKYSVKSHEDGQKVAALESELTKLAMQFQKRNSDAMEAQAEIVNLKATSSKYKLHPNNAAIVLPLSRENLAKFNAKQMMDLPLEQEVEEEGVRAKHNDAENKEDEEIV